MSEDLEKLMNEKMEEIGQTTRVIITPEFDERFGIKGTFYLYSAGMKDNYDKPDLEMRGVPGMFQHVACGTINEINAYQLVADRPLLAGETMQHVIGDIKIEQGDDWEGAYEWKSEDMLRLTSLLTDVTHCESCECRECGITE